MVSFPIGVHAPASHSLAGHHPRLQQSPVTLTITRSLATDIPGVPFALAVEAADIDGRNITGTTVNATLTLPNDTNTALATCQVGAGQGWSTCQLALPSVGQYLLRACVDYDGVPACSVDRLGRDAEDWASAPLDHGPLVQMLARVCCGNACVFCLVFCGTTCMLTMVHPCMIATHGRPSTAYQEGRCGGFV